MFTLSRIENEPSVIVRTPNTENLELQTKVLRGSHRRIFNAGPVSGKEVSALRLLEYGVERFAPASGNGVIITEAAFQKFRPSPNNNATKPKKPNQPNK
jgi:hypothetical protein